MTEGLKRQIRNFLIHSIKLASLLLAASILSFTLVSASPLDPVQQYILGLETAVSPEQRAQLEDYWGLQKPPVERYCSWLVEVLQGNLGESAIYRRPVAEVIGERFWNSLALMLCAWTLAGLTGFTLGCIMGLYPNQWQGRLLKKICYTLSCIPSFWLGLLLLLVFSVWLKWFPIGFSGPIGLSSEEVTLWQRLYHLLLPAATLSIASFSNIALHTREKLLEVMDSDYALFAQARGEDKRSILWRHGLRNILLPALTLQLASFSELFGGSVLAENVFSYPGLGSTIVAAGLGCDVPLLLGITLFSTLFVSVGNGIANLLYGIVDPVIKEAAE